VTHGLLPGADGSGAAGLVALAAGTADAAGEGLLFCGIMAAVT